MSNSKKRFRYLKTIAKRYDVPFSVVLAIATMLPESEDHDALLSALEDYHIIAGAFSSDEKIMSI